MTLPRYRRLRDAVRADVGRAIAMASGGALVFAPVEYVVTSWAYAGPTSLATQLRLIALVGTLALVLWLLLAAALTAAIVIGRLAHTRIAPEAATRAGWFVPGPLVDDLRPGVPRLWGLVAAGLVVALAMQRAGAWAVVRYKEPQLTAALIAAVALALALLMAPAARAAARLAHTAAGGLAAVLPGRLRAINPLGRWRAAGVALVVLVGAALAASWQLLPQSRSVLPVRLTVSALVIALGMGVGARHSALGRNARVMPRRRGRAALLAAAGGSVTVATLLAWGADLETKYVALTASPALERLIGVVRTANDLDRDGFGSLLGDRDCAPFAAAIHPGARDAAGDHIDQDCNGRDLSLADLVAPPGQAPTVPPEMKRDWNILLLTIDTVRYDRTSFGGYRDGAKRRDTTPRLAELVARSTSYSYAQAPSAGTMASIPAILTSKFFHSGIAIDEKRPPGTPPKIMPENTTLPEIMKRAGYRTGVIGSHEWWTDWGLEQGVDDYDNSIGAKADPFRVTADKVTDHALAWISRHQASRWFLWAHYIDPHGRYVAHPNVVDWGTSEADLYDAELRWTDQQVGRLLDELVRLPSHERTIVIITSDHGESMGEHNIPLGTHGSALYREMLHVPLIVYVPGNKPRVIRGAVSNLDIVPTVAELCGIDVRDLSFEGKSLVPSLFYAGADDRDRIVFAETNAPGKQRAAISERWRLIYHLSSNVYELFDRETDPSESTNLALGSPRPAAFETLRAALDAWMNRVLYARDPLFNQAYRQMADVMLRDAPSPPVATTNQRLAGGALEVLGIGPAAGKPVRGKTELHVYFRVAAPVPVGYRFQLVVWPTTGAPTDPVPGDAVRSPAKLTADGAYPSDRWRPGDHVRERFVVTLPPDWTTGTVTLGLVATEPSGSRAPATGAAPANDPTLLVLGALPLGSSPERAP